MALSLAPQDPAEGVRLRSEAKVAVLRAALDANVAASETELQVLPSCMMLCEDHRGYERHMRYFRFFTVGETVEMSWGKNADGSNQSSGALAWLGCGSAPPKRRAVTGVDQVTNLSRGLTVHTDRGDIRIRMVDTAAAERWKMALEAILQAAGLHDGRRCGGALAGRGGLPHGRARANTMVRIRWCGIL